MDDINHISAAMLIKPLCDEDAAEKFFYTMLSSSEQKAAKTIMANIGHRLEVYERIWHCPSNSSDYLLIRRMSKIPLVIPDITLTENLKGYLQLLGYQSEHQLDTVSAAPEVILNAVIST